MCKFADQRVLLGSETDCAPPDSGSLVEEDSCVLVREVPALDLRSLLELLDDAAALAEVFIRGPRRLVCLVPAEQTSGEMWLAIPRAELVARYAPIPLDEPHEVRRV